MKSDGNQRNKNKGFKCFAIVITEKRRFEVAIQYIFLIMSMPHSSENQYAYITYTFV